MCPLGDDIMTIKKKGRDESVQGLLADFAAVYSLKITDSKSLCTVRLSY